MVAAEVIAPAAVQQLSLPAVAHAVTVAAEVAAKAMPDAAPVATTVEAASEALLSTALSFAVEAGRLEAQKELLDKVKATRLKIEVRRSFVKLYE